MTDQGASGEGAGTSAGIRRRRFLGTGLAAAGAALLPTRAIAKPKAASRAAAAAASGAPMPQLSTRAAYPNLPAVPFDAPGILDTVGRLQIRAEQVVQAKQGLTEKLTVDGVTARSYAFLFERGTDAAHTDARNDLSDSVDSDPEGVRMDLGAAQGGGAATTSPSGPLSLERPKQFSISWTTFANVYESGLPFLSKWSASLKDADAATRQFWPMIASHGLGYNLIIPERVTRASSKALRQQFGRAWSRDVREALKAGELYAIDMSRFESLEPQTYNGATRFTPATVTLLIRNPRTQYLIPVAVSVSGHQGANRTVYSRERASDGAWLYALQAAKTSITVFGVWLGHVYHWHLVTAAMQMTMLNTLPASHPVAILLAPQSKFAIPFDDALLALWSQIAPPTSLTTPAQFLSLTNDYAAGRSYFDDDPKNTLKALGLRQKQFTRSAAWDRYPIVGRLLGVWDMVEPYVDTFVSSTYASDAAVAGDADLQAWIATAASADAGTGGNVHGLPEVNSRRALKKVLTSLVYRITAHGVSRLNSTSNPALTFVPNFPHCLQSAEIPSPRASIGTRRLLRYLPNTDAIAQAVTFYFTFAFSTPYESFIPLGGVGAELFFPGDKSDPRNKALIDLRRGIGRFIGDLQPDDPQRFQWPRNIET